MREEGGREQSNAPLFSCVCVWVKNELFFNLIFKGAPL